MAEEVDRLALDDELTRAFRELIHNIAVAHGCPTRFLYGLSKEQFANMVGPGTQAGKRGQSPCQPSIDSGKETDGTHG